MFSLSSYVMSAAAAGTARVNCWFCVQLVSYRYTVPVTVIYLLYRRHRHRHGKNKKISH